MRTVHIRRTGLVAALALAVVAYPRVVSAQGQQPQPTRPSNAVFRGAVTAPHDTLGLTMSLYGAHDDELRGADQSGVSQTPAGGGPFGGLDSSVNYSPARRGRRFSFNFQGSSSLRYYAQQGRFVAAGQSVGVGTTTQLARTVSLQTRGGVSYLPYFDFSLLPDMTEPTGPEVPARIRDNTLATRRTLSYDGGVDLTHSPNERTSLVFRYAARSTQLLDEGQSAVDMTTSAGLNRQLGRRLAASVTYVHRDSQGQRGTGDGSARVDDVELGLDRSWARSPTRRTDFSLTLGPSAIEQRGRRAYRVFGGATLSHPFGRSWSLRALYRRGVTFLDGVSAPFLSDSTTLALSGLLTRKLETSFSVGAVRGDLGFDSGIGSTTPYDTYSGSARMRYALGRTFATYAEYVYNFSRYSAASGLAGINRSGIRVGLSAYVPLMREPAPRGAR